MSMAPDRETSIRLRNRSRRRAVPLQIRLSQLAFTGFAVLTAALFARELVHGRLTLGGIAMSLPFGGGCLFAAIMMGKMVQQALPDTVTFRARGDELEVTARFGDKTLWVDRMSLSESKTPILDETAVPATRGRTAWKRSQGMGRPYVVLNTPQRRIGWDRRDVVGLRATLQALEELQNAARDANQLPGSPARS